MRLAGSRAYARPAPTPTMPSGLVELMEGLAKDVLKNNPENVYEFCTGHMQKLLEIRDGPLPPKKQLSLEEKIAKAQEKIRQRMKSKQIQLDKNDSKQSSVNRQQEEEQSVKQHVENISQESENREHESEHRVKESPINLESIIQPGVHGKDLVMSNEVEIFHEPDVTIATNDISNEEVFQAKQTVEDVALVMQSLDNTKVNDDVNENTTDVAHKVDGEEAAAMQTLELKKSTEKNYDDVMENTIDGTHKTEGDVATTIQALHTLENEKPAEKVNDEKHENRSDDAHKVEGDVASAMQTLDFEQSPEKVNDEINENTNDDTEIVEGEVAAAMQTQELEKPTEKVNDEINENTNDDTQIVEGEVAAAMQTQELEKPTERVNDEINENTRDNTHKIEGAVAAAMQTREPEKSTEKVNVKVNENTSDDTHKIEEAVAAAMQTLEPEKSTEKVNGVVNENTSNDTKQTSNLKPIVESANVSIHNKDLQNKNIVFEHMRSVDQYTKNDATQLDEAKSIIDEDGNDPEAITVTLAVNETSYNTKISDKLKKEISAQRLDDHCEAVVVNADTIHTKDAMDEEKTTIKQESTDIKDENIRIEKYVINVEGEENAGSVKHALDNKTLIHHGHELVSEQVTVEELIGNRPEILHQTITPLNKTENKRTTDNEAPDTADVEALNDQVITAEVVEKTVECLKNHDDQQFHNHNTDTVHENELDSKPSLIDTNDKLPVQERASSEEITVKKNDVLQDDTTIVNANNTKLESEKPIDTAVTGMDLETAAITIQKVFRTFLFSKSRASTLDDSVMGNSLEEDIEKKDEPDYVLASTNLNKERRALGISRMDTVLQTVNEEKSLSLSDDSSLSSAATTIQAHVRGFLVRNRLASNKTASSSSLVNSDGQSTVSLDGDTNEPKKTILNIHIVPERGQFMSRDESLLTSIDLPLDNSPPSSINLHPLGYDKSERRKQLKREDAIQSISPPSNNSGKLSEEVDAVNDAANESVNSKEEHESISANGHEKLTDPDTESCDTTLTISSTAETVIDADAYHTRETLSSPEHNLETDNKTKEAVVNSSSDEMDVVTPFPTIIEKQDKVDNENDEKPRLLHSGEFHDIVVQTQVKRTETSVVREFKNVLVYFLLWDKT